MSNLNHLLFQLWIMLVIQDVFIELFEFLHFVVLHAVLLRLTRYGTNRLADKLLYSNRYILVNEVLHSLDLVKLNVEIVVNLIELGLNLLLLLGKVRFVLLRLF